MIFWFKIVSLIELSSFAQSSNRFHKNSERKSNTWFIHILKTIKNSLKAYLLV